ncbi:MAG: MerR family transcriptional regulator [Burkholderiaceae bacterium]
MLLKVGELAKRTGLTVRTLHHYDAIGLLTPSARSDAGYRLYNNMDIARLHCIQGLRNLGLPLSEIDSMLAVNGASLPNIITRQVHALDQEIARATDLRSRLTMLQDKLTEGGQPETADWLDALELMTTHGKYFSATELKFITDSWKKIEPEWQPLIADIRAAMKKNLAADDHEMQVLARRWMDLSMRWMKDDISLLARWKEMCQKEPAAHGRSGVDPELYQYIGRAIELRVAVYQKYLSIEEIKRLNKNMDAKWADLEKATKKVLVQELPAESEAAQQLVAQWSSLIDETTDHDPVIREKLLNAIRSEPLIQAGAHLSVEVRDFIRRAYFAGVATTVVAE